MWKATINIMIETIQDKEVTEDTSKYALESFWVKPSPLGVSNEIGVLLTLKLGQVRTLICLQWTVGMLCTWYAVCSTRPHPIWLVIEQRYVVFCCGVLITACCTSLVLCRQRIPCTVHAICLVRSRCLFERNTSTTVCLNPFAYGGLKWAHLMQAGC